MGEVINTPGNEMYPFVDSNAELYFASNGHGGLGGLDVFQVNPNDGLDIRNMGYPLNTTADDFGFSLSPDAEKAYISSNREGADNIFQINITAPDLEMILADNSVNGESPILDEAIEPLATNELSTSDEINGSEILEELSTINASIIDEDYEALKDANIKVLANGEEIETRVSNDDGKISLDVPIDKEYTIVASKEGFADKVLTIPASTLGQEEDLLIVMNTGQETDELSITELDPLAVTDDPWDQSAIDSNSRPDIQGVALSELPGESTGAENTDELSTTELDPLAVTDDPWDQSAIDGNSRPDIQGVALSELPGESAGAENTDELSTTELDPLAVTDDPWDQSAIDGNSRPDIQGVALSQLPEESTGAENTDELSTTELDPLAVTDDPWDQSAIDGNSRPDIQGVALSGLPEESTDAENTGDLSTTELDPLAVTDDPWDQSAIDGNSRPDIQGVALTDLPEESAGSVSSDDLSTTELDPLAVTDDPWDQSAIDGNSRPDIQGVALSGLPEESTDAENTGDLSTTELDPLAVTDDPWDQSAIDGNSRPDIQGVALSELPEESTGAETTDELSTTELDPLAVTDDTWDQSAIDDNTNPDFQGQAVSNSPDKSPGIAAAATAATAAATTVASKALSSNQKSDTELDPLASTDNPLDHNAVDGSTQPNIQELALSESSEETALPNSVNAVSNNPLDESAVDSSTRPDIQGVALSESPGETNVENSEELNTTELDPLASTDNPLDHNAVDGSTQPNIQEVALSESPEETASPNTVNAVSNNPWDESAVDSSTRPDIQGVALSESTGETNVENSEELNTTELDPLASTDNPLDQNAVDGSTQPNIQEVALSESLEETALPNSVAAGSDEFTFNEHNALAPTDGPWDQNALNPNANNNAINGVALTQNPNESATEIDTDTNLGQVPTNDQGPLALANDPTNQINVDELDDDDVISESLEKRNMVEAKVFDQNTNLALSDADIKLFIDSPNETVDYQIKDGVLTFEAIPEENYIVVASHVDYQDQFINLSGEELVADKTENLRLELSQNEDLNTPDKDIKGATTKFKAEVRDQETNELLRDAEVKFFVDGKAVESEFSKENGKTIFKSPNGQDHMLLVSRRGYQDLIYHLPGAPEDNMDVDLAMLKDQDYVERDYHQLAIKDRVYDEFTGADLDNVTFKVFENGELIKSTNNLSSIEVDPDNDYHVLATANGFQEQMVRLTPEQLDQSKPVDLPISMRQQQISEVSGETQYDGSEEEGLPVVARILDITNDQPISEAVILVFADESIQDKMTSWNSGTVTINTVPGKDYQLVVQREGYSDQIIPLSDLEKNNQEPLEIAMVPDNIKSIKQSGVDLTDATMLVMSGPNGEEQLYLSTNDELYQYSVENDNHYLIKDGETIMLKERSRSLSAKVTDKQDSDQFNLRSEDQFLYDQLSGDEKAMVNEIVSNLQNGEDLQDHPDLEIYYNNLPPEYRELVDYRVSNKEAVAPIHESIVATSESLDDVLGDNNISVLATLNVNNIYYDFDKSNIREDAAAELDKLVQIMKGNKSIRVMMFSHTDSRGSNSYNDALSKRRGSAAVAYMVERGISKDRFTSEAKGESQLANSCGNTNKCSEQAHQLNRRTEFLLSA